MVELVPAPRLSVLVRSKDVDGRDKPGHDSGDVGRLWYVNTFRPWYYVLTIVARDGDDYQRFVFNKLSKLPIIATTDPHSTCA